MGGETGVSISKMANKKIDRLIKRKSKKKE